MKHKRRIRHAGLSGYMIGLGVIEAVNKVLINQRMKRADMCWSIEGGQNILAFRAMSGRFAAA